MASQSSQSQSSIGGASSNELTVVVILEMTRDPEVWSNFDLCEMSNGTQKARCKKYGTFFIGTSNSNLRGHLAKYCKLLTGDTSSS